MLDKAIVPTAEQLTELVAEATETQTEAEFVSGYIKNLAGILKGKPIMYRAYGPYWWPLKELLINHGHSEFGDSVEAGALTVFRMDGAHLLCCSAWAYHTYNVDNGNVFSASHKIAIADSDDYDYHLHDLEMESLILG
jgi:hypothetical protein